VTYDGVLIDWSGTIAHDPDLAARLRRALCSLGRPHDDDAVVPLLKGHRRAERAPEIIDAVRNYDGGAAEIGITTLILPRQLAHPDLPRLGPLASILDLRPSSEPSALGPR
jgi:hypothetical protein